MTNEDRQTVIQALEVGRDAAAEVATRYHEAMAGYRKSEHERLDTDVARIDAALAIMRREPVPMPLQMTMTHAFVDGVCVYSSDHRQD